MLKLSILGVVILVLSLFELNAKVDRPFIVGGEGPKLTSILGDEGGESDTDYRDLTVGHDKVLLS